MRNLQIIFKDGTITEYKFVDNIIGELMYERFNKTPSEILKMIEYHASSFSTRHELDTELRTEVEKCRNLYNIDMPSIPALEDLDQETFNRVHEEFHVIDEKFSYDEEQNNLDLVETLTKINILVHSYEDYLHNAPGNDYIVLDFLSNPPKFPHPSQTPLDSRYRKFFIHSEPTTVATLSCGYNTVGKNLAHAMWNNDISLVKNNLIRPQVSISNQTVWNNCKRSVIGWKDQLKEFVVENNLQANVGYEDNMHVYTIQPVYAELDTSINNPSDDEWRRLFTKIKIDRFQLT